MPQFYTVLTETGQAKMANAIALGTTINIAELAVGDGGGTLPTPDSDRTTLVNQVRIAQVNRVDTDPDNPAWLIVEQVLPPEVGGWTIREVGLFDDAGDLIGYGNYPETYKPVLSEGSGRTLTIRMVLEVSDTAAVTLLVDPSVVLATREYVDDQRDEHEQSRSHPLATESLKGMIKRATEAMALGGTDNAAAMTALRVFQAMGVFGLGTAESLNGADLSTDGGDGLRVFLATNGVDRPASASTNGFIIEVGSAGSTYAARFFLDYNEQRLYYRRRSPEGWVEIYHTGMLGAATTTAKGLVEKAATSEAKSGAADKFPDAAGVKVALDDRIADQTTVDAGTNDSKFVTPKKLKAWATSWVKQATETVAGMLKVATQAQTDAGADDTTAVTPKKLRWGVSFSMAETGYVAFPSWLGGLIVQWGRTAEVSPGSTGTITFPIAFPNAIYCLPMGTESTFSGAEVIARPMTFSLTTCDWVLEVVDTGSNEARGNWLAIGR